MFEFYVFGVGVGSLNRECSETCEDGDEDEGKYLAMKMKVNGTDSKAMKKMGLIDMGGRGRTENVEMNIVCRGMSTITHVPNFSKCRR